MRIVFAGTADFALLSLQSLIHFCRQFDDYELLGVYTQPDRKSGRGRILQANTIKQCAEMHALPLYQPASLKKETTQDTLKNLQPDLMIVAAYGLLLPSDVLAIPRFGCINVHASLLPRWRGAAPIQRALLAGDTQTGITIMQMDKGLDTGDMLHQVEIPILDIDTSKSLSAKLATLGAEALLTTIRALFAKQSAKQLQPEEGALYATKLTKEEGMVDWSLPAITIERQTRAFNPWPVSFSWVQGEKLRIWQAKAQSAKDLKIVSPGTIIQVDKAGIQVATGQGIIQLTQLQRAGGRCLPVADLLNGPLAYLRSGMCFQGLNKEA